MWQIPSVTIHDNTFTKCYVWYDGGAIEIYKCSTEERTDTVINNFLFLNYKGDDGCGGRVCADNNKQYDNFLTNSLFSEYSDKYGGALYLS